MNGWIKIHRKLTEWEWYSDTKTFRVYMHLLLTANHQKTNWRGETIQAGQVLTGRHQIAKSVDLSEQNVRTALTNLQTTNEITIKSTNRYSIISINKWSDYQQELTSQQTSNQPASQPTTNQQLTTSKNVKKNKNIRNIYISKFNSLETINNQQVFSEVASSFGISPSTVAKSYEDLELYCHANGRVYKNYKAALSTFVKRKLERKP